MSLKSSVEYAYEWNQAGYVLEDATTTQETHLTYMQNNRTAGFFIKGEEGQAEQITTGTGVEVECIKVLKSIYQDNGCKLYWFCHFSHQWNIRKQP